jgi:hypothetical protein
MGEHTSWVSACKERIPHSLQVKKCLHAYFGLPHASICLMLQQLSMNDCLHYISCQMQTLELDCVCKVVSCEARMACLHPVRNVTTHAEG